MMRVDKLILRAYGRCRDIAVDLGEGVTVVIGANEAGKSTSLDALNDFLWGIPRNSVRASELARSQLCIEARLTVDGEPVTLTRKSTGLFADDLVTEFVPPWNPHDQLSAQWWRTRLGFNHADLRRGGHEVFSGSGDLADIIFSAREGRSAREVLHEITEQAESIFKPDGRARKAQLRVALEEYKSAVADRDRRLTRANTVVEQRRVVEELKKKWFQLRDAATATSQAVNRAEEGNRVVGAVLALAQANRELEPIDAEGDRLSEAELIDYEQASEDQRKASARITALSNDIDVKSHAVEELAVDDGLLLDAATFNRLQPYVKSRIEELRRADEEFGAEVAQVSAELVTLLAGIDVEVDDDLDTAIKRAKISDDDAATLDELAERLECLERKRQDSRDERDRALTGLVGKGITIDIATCRAPDASVIGDLRAALITACQNEQRAETRCEEAATALQTVQSSSSAPLDEVALHHDAVVEARRRRDERWHSIRRSWVSGELPSDGERIGLAAEFDTESATSDRIADDEATERARLAALHVRNAVHVEEVQTAQRKLREATSTVVAEVENRRRAQRAWESAWTDLGIASAPDVDNSSAVVELLTAAHVGHAQERLVDEQIGEKSILWCNAAERAGLPAGTAKSPATAAWRKRVETLDQITSVDAKRAQFGKREKAARDNWEIFRAEAEDLLRRHHVIEECQQVTPALVEQGFAKLGRQLDNATSADAQRTAHLAQIEEKSAERDLVVGDHESATAALQRLADAHASVSDDDLVVLAERARLAAEPLARQRAKTEAVKTGLSSGSDLHDVVQRLAGHDEVTVIDAVREATQRDVEARHAAEEALSAYTSAADRLRELEKAAGAADAQAAVAACQANVAQLVESWAILALQRKLLEDTLGAIAAGDTRPLLDHAGQLLDALTEGRWVALRAEENGASRKLQVIRADNTPCDTSQLSEGTADQVFFALRLAAVAELHHEREQSGAMRLPLVLDDVLMAFDESRVHSALKILLSLAPGLQIVVFTHHQHVADAAAALDRVTVSRLPDPAPITDAVNSELLRAQPRQVQSVMNPITV